MEKDLIFLIFFSYIINISGNYIIIPFDSIIYNPNNDSKMPTDFLSSKLSEKIYFNLTLSNLNQTIKAFITFDQYELTIKDQYNISFISDSFKFINKVDFPNLITFDEKDIIARENFQFMTVYSDKDLNNFLHGNIQNRIEKEKESIKEYKNIIFKYFNESMVNRLNPFLEEHNYSSLGLRFDRFFDVYPNFIYNLKKLNYINSSVFSFIFNKENNTEHLGYLIIGDEFKDIEYDIDNSINTNIKRNHYDWNLEVYNINSQSKKENSSSYYEDNVDIQFKVEKSYILGNKCYKEFIENEFFNELVVKNICEYKNILSENYIGAYACNGKSHIFLDYYYDNKFPDLIFHGDIKYILTKEDLFIRNTKNPKDTKFYFIIFFDDNKIKCNFWELGRIFLKKYRFYFNLDKSAVIYHPKKKLATIKDNPFSQPLNKTTLILIIIFSIFIAIIIIIFSIFCYQYLKKQRKKKVYELDDEFEYKKNENDNQLFVEK